MSARIDFIETASGRRFKPLDPTEGEIAIEDIAHSLSQQCRFSGHTRQHYSVAEHCVRVHDLISTWGASREVRLWGLLHDASEAYLVDIPQPLKHTEAFAAYRVAERAMMVAVCVRFGLSLEEPAIVRRADGVLLATEARDLMPYRPEHWSTLVEQALPGKIIPMTAGQAKWRFLETYAEIVQEAGQ